MCFSLNQIYLIKDTWQKIDAYSNTRYHMSTNKYELVSV